MTNQTREKLKSILTNAYGSHNRDYVADEIEQLMRYERKSMLDEVSDWLDSEKRVPEEGDTLHEFDVDHNGSLELIKTGFTHRFSMADNNEIYEQEN